MPFYHSYSGAEADNRPPPRDAAGRPPPASGPSADLYARVARRYRRPSFGLDTTWACGVRVPVRERSLPVNPFVTLIAFDRLLPDPSASQPRVLVLPPAAGHCPTLVRDTVAAFLPDHFVHVASWSDARDVPLAAGAFGLAEAAEAVAGMVAMIGGAVHVVAVTEAGVVGLAAAAVLAASGRPLASLTLLGGPVDCRADLAGLAAGAAARGLDWFMRTAIAPVPAPFAGAYREVFPGFFTLTGFLTSNLDRSFTDHRELFTRLVAGDGDTPEGRRDFFDEFLAVSDVPAEFTLQWIDAVLINAPFAPDAAGGRSPLGPTPLMTVEAGRDGFGGGGQTHAARSFCATPDTTLALTEQDAGRFALFTGARWRSHVFPRVGDFIAGHDAPPPRARPAPPEDLRGVGGMTAALAARLNREGVYFAGQLAGLDDAGSDDLDRRLGTLAHGLVAGLRRELRREGRP